MKRIRYNNFRNAAMSEAGKAIATAYTFCSIAGSIRSSERLVHLHLDWADWDHDELIPEIEATIKEVIEEWLDSTPRTEIIVALTALQESRDGKLSAFLYAKKLVGKKYKCFFTGLPNGVPAPTSRPVVTFFSISRKSGNLMVLSKPHIRETRSTKVTVYGIVPQGKDYKTIFALASVMRRKGPIVYDNFHIYFKTTYTELCKEMRLVNPSGKDSHKAMFSSLVRLRGCVLIYENDKSGKRSIGGVLSKVTELEEDSSGEILIAMDVDFLRLYENGYLPIDPDVLYALTKDNDILLYMYLLGQEEFNKYGTLGVRNKVNLFEVFERTNMTGLGEKVKSNATKKDQIKESLEHLKQLHAFRTFKILKDNNLKIRKMNKLVIDNKKMIEN